MGRAVTEKRRAFEEWLLRRDRVTRQIPGTESGCEMGSPGAGLSKVFTTLYLIVYLVTRATML